jgi:CBS domain-containing protein
MHELAHSWMARSRGVDVQGITLFLFGGVSNLKGEAKSAEDEFVIAIVGPLMSLGMGLFFAVGWGVLQFWNKGIAGISANLAVLNAVIAAFNLLPGFPLDGGRVFRSLLWWRNRNLLAATRVAARVGEYFSYGLMGVGVVFFLFGNLIGGIWLFIIGLFLRSASLGSYQQTLAQVTLAGMTAGQAARSDCQLVSPDISVAQLVDSYILPGNIRCFPIQRDGQLLGLVTLDDVRQVPREEWATTSVAKTMTPYERLHVVSREEDLRRVMQIMSEEDVNQVPVVEDGRLVGLIARSDIMRLLRIRQELTEET